MRSVFSDSRATTAMDFTCSQCESPLQATATDGTTTIACPSCGTSVQVPHDGSVCTLTHALHSASPASTVAGVQGEENTQPYYGGEFRAPTAIPAAGQPFGDYELLGEIARGGMGVVYKARQVSLNRPVALKMILSSHLATAEQVRRFRTEAENAAKLDHSCIVPVYEVGEREGQHFFSMGLVEGGTLTDLVCEKPLPPRQAAEMTAKIGDAIQYAHSRNIVHRDLKPANVLLGDDGEPKITDFGLAKNIDEAHGHTLTGQVMGTPNYMAPEQAAGRVDEVGPPADVYALGGILYFLLTGRPPFRGTNVGDTLRQVLEHEAVSPRQLNSQVDVDLATICLKCLEKPPGRRYASAGQLADELRRYLAGEPITARPVGPFERGWRWARRHPARAAALTASVVAILALVVVAVGARYQGEITTANQRLEKSNLDLRQTQDELQTSNDKLNDSLHREQALGDQRKILLAHVAWKEHKTGRAHKLLAEIPEERRRWEWRYVGRLCNSAETTFVGHRAAADGRRWLFGVAVSPDGLRIASGGLDQRVVVWNVDTNKALVLSHGATVRCVAFSPDGRWIVSGGFDRKAVIWDAAAGKRAALMEGHQHTVLGVAINRTGDRIATAAADQTVKLWNWNAAEKTATLIHTFSGPGRHMYSVAFHPDGNWLAASGGNKPDEPGEIVVWDIEKREPVMSAKDPAGPVYAVIFDLQGRLTSTGCDNTAKTWDVTAGKVVHTLGQPNEKFMLHDVACTADGEQLVAASEDGTVTVWDVNSNQRRVTLHGHTGQVVSVDVSPQGKIVTASLDGTVKTWDPITGQPSLPLAGHRDVVTCAAAGGDGKLIATASADGTVIVRDAATRKVLHTYTGHAAVVNAVAFSRDGKRIASGSDDQTIHIWGPTTGKLVFPPLKGHVGEVLGLAFHGEGEETLLASAGADRTIKLWNAAAGKQIGELVGHSAPVQGVAFSPDGRRLASTSHDRTVKLWDVGSRQILQSFTEHRAETWGVTFSPDGKRVASTGKDGHVRVWNAESGEEECVLAGHGHWVAGVVFTKDGTRIASAGLDGTVRLWDPQSGLETFVLEGHAAGVVSLAFTPDDRRIISASIDKTARIWNAGGEATVVSLDYANR